MTDKILTELSHREILNKLLRDFKEVESSSDFNSSKETRESKDSYLEKVSECIQLSFETAVTLNIDVCQFILAALGMAYFKEELAKRDKADSN